MQAGEIPTSLHIVEIKARIEPILRKYEVVHASVFGSMASGTAGPDSDLDLLIEFAPGAKKSLLDLVGLQQELESTLGRKVDVGFAHTLKPRLRERILAEQVAIL